MLKNVAQNKGHATHLVVILVNSFLFLIFFWYLVLGTLMYTIEESYITVINYLNRMIGAKILEKKMA